VERTWVFTRERRSPGNGKERFGEPHETSRNHPKVLPAAIPIMCLITPNVGMRHLERYSC